jgi:hypothetical protein
MKTAGEETYKPIRFDKKFFQKKEEAELFEKAEETLDSDMSYFKLFQDVKKIKASLSLLVGNDTKMIENVKLLYKKLSTIYTDEKEAKDFQNSKNEFMNFLESDEIMA